jgi:hypothetical protein
MLRLILSTSMSSQVQLTKPMGMILEEGQNPQRVFVAELSESGSATCSIGKVLAGDIVQKVGPLDCSAGSTLEQVWFVIPKDHDGSQRSCAP